MASDNLSQLEVLALSAVIMLRDDAYGMTIHAQVEELAKGYRAVSLGSVYTCLDRLEQQGYVKSWFGGATAERGGRAKRYFEITGTGERAVEAALSVAGRVADGLRGVEGLG